jgi:spermidine synthase
MNAPIFEILAYEQTPLGILCLRKRELLSQPGTVVYEVTLDNEFLMSSFYTVSERELSARALAMHGGEGLRVMVGGLGLGYTAAEILGSERVADVEVVEYLPQVIGWLEQGLFPLADTLRADGRLTVVADDVYARLLAPPNQRYDLILIDVDHSPDEILAGANAEFYTERGLRAAQQHLADGGVLGVWSSAESSSFATRFNALFRDVQVLPISFHNALVDETTTDWLFLGRV